MMSGKSQEQSQTPLDMIRHKHIVPDGNAALRRILKFGSWVAKGGKLGFAMRPQFCGKSWDADVLGALR